MKSIFLNIFFLSSFAGAENLAPMASSKTQYTMIDSISIKTLNQMSCDIAVAMSLDRKEIRVLRLDSPKGKMNLTYLAKNPEVVSKIGISYQILNLVETRGLNVQTAQASFDIDKTKTDLILFITLEDDSVAERRISITADFFKDNAKQCIK